MTYDAKEKSDDDAKPVELYEFRGLDGVAYRYTSHTADVMRGVNIFRSITIKRNALKASTQDSDQHALEITIPGTEQLVQDYATRISPPKLDLTIYRYQEDESPTDDAVIYWLGPVVSFKIKGDEASVVSSSIFGSALSGEIPSVHFQGQCNWVLYDNQCKVNRSNWQFTTTAEAVGLNTVEVPNIPGQFTASDFVGGEIVVPRTGERRSIVAMAGPICAINYPFADLVEGDDISVAAGCNHGWSTCKNKFNNASEYGGDRFIPYVNPFSEGIG